jgi:1-aminocyclopropane-1-carboxylate deaminase/D-cysteine desulfhydrase-like pyridoxal-dependent ACC family enzyme
VLQDGHIGRGYGHPTAAGDDAARALTGAGLALDATYTAKAGAALLDSLRRQPAGPVLFWHTLSASAPLPALPGVDALPPAFRRYVARGGTR